MSHSIHAPIGYSGGNSLSPDACVLIPYVPIHASRLTRGRGCPVDNSRATVGRCMDGSLRDQFGGVSCR